MTGRHIHIHIHIHTHIDREHENGNENGYENEMVKNREEMLQISITVMLNENEVQTNLFSLRDDLIIGLNTTATATATSTAATTIETISAYPFTSSQLFYSCQI